LQRENEKRGAINAAFALQQCFPATPANGQWHFRRLLYIGATPIREQRITLLGKKSRRRNHA
jgi:hypothetical protein